jgi:hypothetical protein
MSEHKVRPVDVPVTVCQDGTIGGNSSSITFVNYNTNPCTITSCGVPGWPSPPQPNPQIPASPGGGVPGSKTVQLAGQTRPGTYPYTSDCCPGATNPKIIVQ